jgi:GGDEF domain-containing protein
MALDHFKEVNDLGGHAARRKRRNQMMERQVTQGNPQDPC